MDWSLFTPKVTADANKWVSKFGLVKPSSKDSKKAAKEAATELCCGEDAWGEFEDRYIEVFEEKVWRLQAKPIGKPITEPEPKLPLTISPKPTTNFISRIIAALKGKG
ncbi:MAG: hypothetical protein WCT03_16035 [Candidatus Obscuribacterales bacterium]|jgi:hypothetical protein